MYLAIPFQLCLNQCQRCARVSAHPFNQKHVHHFSGVNIHFGPFSKCINLQVDEPDWSEKRADALRATTANYQGQCTPRLAPFVFESRSFKLMAATAASIRKFKVPSLVLLVQYTLMPFHLDIWIFS